MAIIPEKLDDNKINAFAFEFQNLYYASGRIGDITDFIIECMDAYEKARKTIHEYQQNKQPSRDSLSFRDILDGKLLEENSVKYSMAIVPEMLDDNKINAFAFEIVKLYYTSGKTGNIKDFTIEYMENYDKSRKAMYEYKQRQQQLMANLSFGDLLDEDSRPLSETETKHTSILR